MDLYGVNIIFLENKFDRTFFHFIFIEMKMIYSIFISFCNLKQEKCQIYYPACISFNMGCFSLKNFRF